MERLKKACFRWPQKLPFDVIDVNAQEINWLLDTELPYDNSLEDIEALLRFEQKTGVCLGCLKLNRPFTKID